MLEKRASGILMHVTSLPSDYSVGTLGRSAYSFVDFLSEGGFSYWQVLPLCMTDECASPYKSAGYYSANPYLIDLEILHGSGLITSSELESARERAPYVAEYDRLSEERLPLLFRAAGRVRDRDAVRDFLDIHPTIASLARYLALRDKNNGAPFREWRDSEPDEDRLFAWQFIQYEFHRQWQLLKEYANRMGVYIIGDMPIYVAYESADVWASPECFLLDRDGLPLEVAGVPPDYFSEDGQLWGNPLYDFEYMKMDGYLFWKSRIDYALTMFDGVRIDHFRALDEYYSIPRDAVSAREGRWMPGPARSIIDKIREWAGDKLIIAEDLGDITDSVRELLEYSTFPGMRVAQFGFLSSGESIHRPHLFPENSVAYTGTHDNNTLLGYVWELDPDTRGRLFEYMGIRHDDWSAACLDIISVLLRSPSRLVIIPIQDILGFGSDTRMNTPGRSDGNWGFRITEDNLRELSENSGRWKRLNTLFGRK